MYDCSLLILYVVICILWSKRHTSLLVTKAIGVPPVWPVWVLLLWQADCGWSGWLGWSLVQLVPDPVSCRGCWLAGLGHRAAGCGTLGEGRAHVGSFVGGVGAQQTWGWTPDTGQWSQVLGLCCPTGGQIWVLGSGCRAQGSQSWYWIAVGWDLFLTQLAVQSRVSWSCVGLLVGGARAQPVQGWCWPEGRWAAVILSVVSIPAAGGGWACC